MYLTFMILANFLAIQKAQSIFYKIKTIVWTLNSFCDLKILCKTFKKTHIRITFRTLSIFFIYDLSVKFVLNVLHYLSLLKIKITL